MLVLSASQIPLLPDIIVLLVVSAVVILLFSRFKLPAIIGFLVTGVLIGPAGLGLVHAHYAVSALAEIGVVLLMFTIGLEFSLGSLAQISRIVLLGGGLQVFGTIAAVWAIATRLGLPSPEAVFMGFLLSLSSTAIVLKLLQDRTQVETFLGRVVLAILIFQDLIVVPMMLVTPMLGAGAATEAGVFTTLGVLALKLLGVAVLVWVGARHLMPRLLFLVARTRSRELFLLTVVGTCLGVAYATGFAGLSLALGAFLAGLIISESEYAYQAVSNVMPFRELFSSFFFVSIGMFLDPNYLVSNPFIILGAAVGVMLLKTLTTSASVLALRLPGRVAVTAGLALSQVGEFAFVLSLVGVQAGVMGQQAYQFFLALSILTMALTPLAMFAAPRLGLWVARLPAPKWFLPMPSALRLKDENPTALRNHLVVVGYGLSGRNIVKAAKQMAIPYIIIDMNAVSVRQERLRGEPIVYGDAAQAHVLEQVGAGLAKVVVVAISDPQATRHVTLAVRKLNPHTCIIVRTKYAREVEELRLLGATEVISEEFEASVEVVARVLAMYMVPLGEIERHVADLRRDCYLMLRGHSLTAQAWSHLHLSLTEAEVASVEIGLASPFLNRTLAELHLRAIYGVNVLGLRRDGQMHYGPSPEDAFRDGDVLYVFGQHDAIRLFLDACTPTPFPA